MRDKKDIKIDDNIQGRTGIVLMPPLLPVKKGVNYSRYLKDDKHGEKTSTEQNDVET